MYNHNKAQQSKNRVHLYWDILLVIQPMFAYEQFLLTGVLSVYFFILVPILFQEIQKYDFIVDNLETMKCLMHLK